VKPTEVYPKPNLALVVPSAGEREAALREQLDNPHHRRQLTDESGIDPRVVLERGYRTLKTKAELDRLGFPEKQQQAPALLVPMYGPTGQPTTHQIKPDSPRSGKDGKPIKYETPARSQLHLDVHPSQVQRVKDPTIPLWITEGVKKADCLVSHGQCAVALQGVWCWQKNGVPLPEWEDIKLHGRQVFVVFDSDVMIKANVQLALGRLVAFLASRGAEIKIFYLPDEADTKKQGVDEYLVSGGTVRQLMEMAEVYKPERNGKLGTITAADLMAQELPPPTWIVPGILPEGVTLLAGKPKLSKSWMALGIGVAVATGGVTLGTKHMEEGSCLYLALEDNVRRLQRRLRKLLRGERAPEKLHIATEWSRLDDGGVEQLRDWLSTHQDARLIVIDTLAKVRPRQSGKNVYAEDYAALERLLPLASEHGVAVVVVHHLRKGEATDPLDEISGSTGLTGGVDGVLVLKRDRSKADATLHVDGRDIEDPTELALGWDASIASWAIVGDVEEYRQAELRRDIMRVLEEAGEGLGPKVVTKRLGEEGKKVKYNTVKQRMWQMAEDGQLVNEGSKYAPNNRNFHNLDNHHDHGYRDGPAKDTQVMQSGNHNNQAPGSEPSENGHSCSPVTGVTQVTVPTDVPDHSNDDSRAPGVSANVIAS